MSDYIRLFLISGLIILIGNYSQICAAVLQVPENYESIQAAIDSSADADTVLIAPGIYHERINFNGKSIVVGSYMLTTGNDQFIRQTVIDGDSLGTVVTFTGGSDNRTLLSGLTIQNGGQVDDGGGIFCRGSSPTLEYLIVQNCVVGRNEGGGAYFDSSDVVFRNSTLMNNSARDGAGIYAGSGNYSHINFLSNSGTAFYSAGQVIVEDCLFERNEGSRFRGVVYSSRSGSIFRRLVIRNNEGLGISCCGDSSFFQDILVLNNHGSERGGAYFNSSKSVFNRVLFANNSTTDDRNASTLKFVADSYPVFSNITIVAGENLGASLIGFNGHVWPVFINSIIDRNQDDLFAFWPSPGSSITFANCCFPDSVGIHMRNSDSLDWADGNIIADPNYVSRDWQDFRLREDSPCIDMGTRRFFRDGVALVDIQDDEFSGAGPDIGWFEFDFPSSVYPQKPAPDRFRLFANYPNPFNASTTISFDLLKPSFVRLNVYDLQGAKVASLMEDNLPSGCHQFQWNAQTIASGTYFINLESAGQNAIRPIMLIK